MCKGWFIKVIPILIPASASCLGRGFKPGAIVANKKVPTPGSIHKLTCCSVFPPQLLSSIFLGFEQKSSLAVSCSFTEASLGRVINETIANKNAQRAQIGATKCKQIQASTNKCKQAKIPKHMEWIPRAHDCCHLERVWLKRTFILEPVVMSKTSIEQKFGCIDGGRKGPMKAG